MTVQCIHMIFLHTCVFGVCVCRKECFKVACGHWSSEAPAPDDGGCSSPGTSAQHSYQA